MKALIILLAFAVLVSGCAQQGPAAPGPAQGSQQQAVPDNANLLDLFPSALPSGVTQMAKRMSTQAEIKDSDLVDITELAQASYSVPESAKLPGEEALMQIFIGKATSADTARSMISTVETKAGETPGASIKSTTINSHETKEIIIKLSFGDISITTTSFIWTNGPYVFQVAGVGVNRDTVFSLAQSVKY